jgi:hypothetical protein
MREKVLYPWNLLSCQQQGHNNAAAAFGAMTFDACAWA